MTRRYRAGRTLIEEAPEALELGRRGRPWAPRSAPIARSRSGSASTAVARAARTGSALPFQNELLGGLELDEVCDGQSGLLSERERRSVAPPPAVARRCSSRRLRSPSPRPAQATGARRPRRCSRRRERAVTRRPDRGAQRAARARRRSRVRCERRAPHPPRPRAGRRRLPTAASPMNFSSVPPWRVTAARTAEK